MTFAKVVSLCCCVAAFGVVVAACGVLWPPFPPLSLTFRPLERHPPFAFPPCLCLYACVPAGRHKGRRTGRQVGKDASPEAGRRADRFACKGKGLSQRLYPFAVAWQHLALSWQLVAFFTRPYRHSSCVWLVAVIWHFHHSDACMPACRQAGTRASRLAGR